MHTKCMFDFSFPACVLFFYFTSHHFHQNKQKASEQREEKKFSTSLEAKLFYDRRFYLCKQPAAPGVLPVVVARVIE